MFYSHVKSAAKGYAYRYGKWKYVVGGISMVTQHNAHLGSASHPTALHAHAGGAATEPWS